MNNVLLQKLDKSLDYLSWNVSTKTNLEKEDIRQELLLRCLEVQDQYDSSRGQETTFFITVMKNQAKAIIRENCKKKRLLRVIKIEELNYYDAGLCTVQNWNNSIIYSDINFENRTITIQILEKVKEKLGGRPKLILEELMKNSRVKDISEKLGTSHNNVSNIIRRKIRPLVDLEF